MTDKIKLKEKINAITEECGIPFCKNQIVENSDFCIFHNDPKRITKRDIKHILENYNSDMFIYFITTKEFNVVKIGRSECPEERMRVLQPGSPVKLELFCELALDMRYEGVFHELFSGERIHNEWFNISNRLKEFMDLAKKEGEKGVISYLKSNYG